ncbi:unnamed protein product [Trichogramma brassicae]|uniref:Reverse transcriptase domain-containing protein n=1 Tax=Trichogramma brassicae TaxID=86971 RepID=A0A6H5IR04_9HYME|nr:unnamed protein product [Trichogramma brassicae]
MQLAWIYKEDMPRVCRKRKRESVVEVATTSGPDNRTSLIASDEQKREAHHQAESPSTANDNQPLDAKIVVESIRDAPPELSAEQTGQCLQSAKFITTLDLSAAFHQVPMSAGSEKYTAFTVPSLGLFEWTRMPYGVAGGPATFQELADKIIGPEMEPVAFAYIDDTIIATATYAEHLKWLEHVLKRINQAGLTINRDKSFFCRSEVKYLGVIVVKNGFRPDPDKIAPVAEMTAPKTLKQLRRFLCMASWYRKFLENFAMIADPPE